MVTVNSGAFGDFAVIPAVRPGIDLARIIAAFFIVWDHSFAPGWQYCDPALSLFLLLTAFLSLQSYERSGGGAGFWRKRALRLIVPWLFWCVTFRIIVEVIANQPGPWTLISDPYSLLIGPVIHLWFLPFCILCLGFVPLASNLIRTQRALIVALAVLAVVSLPLLALHSQSILPEPLAQWSLALPIYLFGLLHAVAHRLGARWVTQTAALGISALFLTIWPQFWALQIALGVILFELAWRLPVVADWPATAAKTAFGIYLIHPAFALVMHKVWGAPPDPIALALVTFFAALVTTLVMLRLPYLRRVV